MEVSVLCFLTYRLVIFYWRDFGEEDIILCFFCNKLGTKKERKSKRLTREQLFWKWTFHNIKHNCKPAYWYLFSNNHTPPGFYS